jgi:hypothetical protein
MRQIKLQNGFSLDKNNRKILGFAARKLANTNIYANQT